MVKGAVMCVNAKPVKKVPVEMKKCKKCCIKSCNTFVHTICKSKTYCYKHANPEHKKNVSIALKIMLKLWGFLSRMFWRQKKAKEALKCFVCNLSTACQIGAKCEGCLDVKCYDNKRNKRMRTTK